MSVHLGSALSSRRNRIFSRPAARLWFVIAPRGAARAGCAMLLGALPVMALVAAVLATSTGPTLTRLGRIGPDGRVIFLWQFRTIYRYGMGHGALPGRSRRTTPVGWALQRSRRARLPALLDVWRGKTYAAVIIGAAIIGHIASPVRAQSASRPQRVFACPLGKKSVSVTAVGDQLIYRFGTPPTRNYQSSEVPVRGMSSIALHVMRAWSTNCAS